MEMGNTTVVSTENKDVTTCDEIESAIERFAEKVVLKNYDIVIICYDETKPKTFVKKLENGQSSKLVIFISLFDENDPEFMSCYKDWLFVIKHFAHVLKLPITLYELRTIVSKEPKEYLSLDRIATVYMGVKEKIKSSSSK